MRCMRSLLAVALLASAAPMILADGIVETTNVAADETVAAVNTAVGEATTAVNNAAAAELPEVDLPEMPEAPDLDGTLDALKAAAAEGTATLDQANPGLPTITNTLPEHAVVISLTPGAKPGCYTIGEPTNQLAEFCKDPAAAVEKANPINGVEYEWVTGTLKNVGGTDLCHFSSAPLKLQPALMDMVKLPAGEAATPFEHLALPDTKLQVIKLPNEQVLHAQLLLPVDVSKITAAAPLTGVPGAAALSANLQPCEVLDSLQEPKLVEGFTASLSKLAGAAAPATAAADDTKAAVTAATETAPEAATDATAGAVDAIAKAASEAADAVAAVPAKIEEALSPQATEEEGVEVQAISPANSLTASIVGLAAVAAALAFQFVL